ncbi:hypothetical protein SS50377_20597 [Spironucleus salmonicida]|uniref:Uncharacterized protein n=1 Tax=Spironucleus salmonicida TaxID=348837 RepID=V6LME5_9EUKA|nr:hypothetical protein SS50377_28781 [Spironucleus salmonicida]KAH0577246.1 hypothetical protein SS50377_20597 [Spironucleus salmonicida]|eukprot:EST45867.1 hypothetical protein SS50377_14154 [Spironucleus salmonicida]
MEIDPTRPIYLQCSPNLLEKVLPQLPANPFISTSFQTCTNLVEARKLENVQIVHINPKCTCRAAENDVIYLTEDLKPYTYDFSTTTKYEDLPPYIQALQHSKLSRSPEYETIHFDLAKGRMNMLRVRNFESIFLIVSPSVASVELAKRIKFALKKLSISCILTNFGPQITEQKLQNLVFSGEFVAVSDCKIHNVPWLNGRWRREVLCLWELAVGLGAAEVSLEWECCGETVVAQIEAFASRKLDEAG